MFTCVVTASFLANRKISPDVLSIHKLSDFEGDIGLQRGANFGQEFEQHVLLDSLVNTKLVYQPNVMKHYSMLKLQRVNAIIDDELIIKYMMKEKEISQNQFSIRFNLRGNPVYFGISKKSVSPELFKKLNDTWLSMIEDEIVESIYKQYDLIIDASLHDKKFIIKGTD